MENIGNRIRNIRKFLNKSQAELAQECGITKQAISNIENSKSMPSINFLSQLLFDYDINLNYVLGATGEMFVKSQKSTESLRESILKEVEKILNYRGIN